MSASDEAEAVRKNLTDEKHNKKGEASDSTSEVSSDNVETVQADSQMSSELSKDEKVDQAEDFEVNDTEASDLAGDQDDANTNTSVTDTEGNTRQEVEAKTMAVNKADELEAATSLPDSQDTGNACEKKEDLDNDNGQHQHGSPLTSDRDAMQPDLLPTKEKEQADDTMGVSSDLLLPDLTKESAPSADNEEVKSEEKQVENLHVREKEQAGTPSPGSNSESNTTSESTSENPSTSATTESAQTSSELTDTSGSEKAPLQSVYHVKWIKYKNNSHAIITQNENGPCPLLAIMNVLLLQGKVKLPAMMEMVTSGQLMEYLGDCIFENAPKNISEDAQLNYEQNMHDAMAVFHKLQTGLDVNVKFTGVNDFEYTPECIVFDLTGIKLFHGWLVDPQELSEVAAVGNCSYNQLVEKIIAQKASDKEEQVTEALIAEDFLQRSASQLTYHGLSELASTVKENELCVFFRNNHFSTLYKNKNELFLLVTDQGFLTESNVVWETLSNVEGDGHFVDASFHTFRKPQPSTVPIPTPNVPIGSDQQIDQDLLLALSLQDEGGSQDTGEVSVPYDATTNAPILSDHELAMQLQEEENRQAAAALQQQQQQQQQQAAAGRGVQQPGVATAGAAAQRPQAVGGSRERKKSSSDCTIL